ncbi:MAG: hypothetical protein Q4A21_02935 [bacterium]|nr:hypothetical protein [bacterium]
MKKFFSKLFITALLALGFVGATALEDNTVKADTRSISFVIDKSLTNGNPILNSRIVIADAYDNDQSTSRQMVNYQSARSFRIQTGRSYNVVVEGRYQLFGFLPVPFGRHVKTVYVPHGAIMVYIK